MLDDDLTFGPWLRERRRACDLTRAELAAAVGCSVSALRKFESDTLRPSRPLAEALADALAIAPQNHAAFVRFARDMPGDAPVLLPVPIVSQDHPAPPARVYSNLPAPPTALIGREQECAALGHLLRQADTRLVTLTGPGGIGKTRLGLQVAADLVEDFTDGVYFVDLAPIHDPALVATAIAQTLGVRESGSQPLLERLKDDLRDKHMLLLLDNFEHLLDAAAHVAELLATTTRLKLLVTSREHLHLRGEQEVAVPSLALPPTTDHRPFDTAQGRPPTTDHQHAHVEADIIEQYAAIALFIQRAQASQPKFQQTSANAAAIVTICARLDGLPLAIELAAARVKLFSPQALLARLDHQLSFLSSGARDLPARQQTIRATVDWSYNLLTEAEQTLLRRLGVFVGGCTLDAAEAVCGDKRTRRQEDEETEQEPTHPLSPNLHVSVSVLDSLAALLDKNLLQHVQKPDGEPRFTMLETIREYALERLEANNEAEVLRRQHARYYLGLGEVVFPEPGPWHPARLAHLDRDYHNLWAALAWRQTSAGDPEVALRLTGVLRVLWFRRGIRRQAIAALERALTHPRGVGRTRAHAIARFELGQMLQWTGEYAAARPHYEQTLALAHEVGSSWWYAVAVEHLGGLAAQQGDSASAWAQLTESLALFRTLGYASSIAEALHMLAEVAILDEDPARAEALLAESHVLEHPEYANPDLIGWTLNRLGHAAQLRGAFDDAAQFHLERLECFQAFGDQHFGLPWAYHGLGETALLEQAITEALNR